MRKKNVPKVINYFWFGGKDLPPLVEKCIESWKKYCPSYKIKRWDETNFDVNSCDYIKEAYHAKKWAFVSDYARFKVLYERGGIYLDTDVELIKNLDPIVKNGPFFALENSNYDSIGTGLGMGIEPKNPLYKKIVDYYEKIHFKLSDGTYDEQPINLKIKKYFLESGLKPGVEKPRIDGIVIYPQDYFCPLNYETGRLNITNNTVAIHHYMGSWLDSYDSNMHRLQIKLNKIIGPKNSYVIIRIFKIPHALKKRIKVSGLKNTIAFYKKKYLK